MLPKIRPELEPSPKIESNDSSLKLLKSIFLFLINSCNSTVVITMSTSGPHAPLAFSSSLLASAFLATHGATVTLTIFLGSRPNLDAK